MRKWRGFIYTKWQILTEDMEDLMVVDELYYMLVAEFVTVRGFYFASSIVIGSVRYCMYNIYCKVFFLYRMSTLLQFLQNRGPPLYWQKQKNQHILQLLSVDVLWIHQVLLHFQIMRKFQEKIAVQLEVVLKGDRDSVHSQETHLDSYNSYSISWMPRYPEMMAEKLILSAELLYQ